MAIHEKMLAKNRENISNWAFKLMTIIMELMDVIGNYSNKNFKTLEIRKGQTIVDYGCGPARYIKNISEAVGKKGKVIATDIHPLAIKKVNQTIHKYNLHNVEAILTKGYNSFIDNNSADVILALDMFHMIQNHDALLKEFSRIIKPDGIVIIEDGHQSRTETKRKILDSKIFKIVVENKHHIKCKKE